MDADRITLEQLEDGLRTGRIEKVDYRHFFRADEARSRGPFDPGVELHPDRVEIGSASRFSILREYYGAGQLLIHLQRYFRRQGFDAMRRQQPDGLVIVTRGDSWHLHPLVLDLVDNLRGGYAIRSFDWPGDTLSDIENVGHEYLKAIAELNADIFLLSVGGNDVIGGGALAKFVMDAGGGVAGASGCIRPEYDVLLSDCICRIGEVCRKVLDLSPTIEIGFQGYDHAIPMGGKWLGQPLASKGIKDARVQFEIVRIMVDRFNERLHALARQLGSRVTHLDLRGRVTAGWHDELHPSDEGFAQAASQIVGFFDDVATRKAGR